MKLETENRFKTNNGGFEKITIYPPQIGVVRVKVIGDKLLQNKQTDEVKEKIASYFNRQESGKCKDPKVIKSKTATLEEICELKIHRLENGKPAILAAVFLRGMADIAYEVFGMTKRTVKLGISIPQDKIELKYKTWEVHRDMGRTSGIKRSPIPTIRPIFIDWSCEFEVKFNMKKFTAQDVFNLLNQSGFFIGAGDWRKEKGGSGAYGTYQAGVAK